MKRVELYGQVRRAVYVEGLSRREAARRFGIDPRTVAKMLAFSVPPGYRRSRPPARPKLDPFVGIIERILEEDKGQPAKQQRPSKQGARQIRVILHAKRCPHRPAASSDELSGSGALLADNADDWMRCSLRNSAA